MLQPRRGVRPQNPRGGYTEADQEVLGVLVVFGITSELVSDRNVFVHSNDAETTRAAALAAVCSEGLEAGLNSASG